MEKKMKIKVKPSVQSILIADRVIQEKNTNKWSIIGVFDRIIAKKFPIIHPSLALYIRLNDAQGKYNIRVEFCDSNGRKLALFKGLTLVVSSRLDNPDFGIQTYNLPIPKPGKYFFNFYFNEEFIKDFPIEIQQISK